MKNILNILGIAFALTGCVLGVVTSNWTAMLANLTCALLFLARIIDQRRNNRC